MTSASNSNAPTPPAALLAVGNTRARTAGLVDGRMHGGAAHEVIDAENIAAALGGFLDEHHGAPLVVASVNSPAADAIVRLLEGRAETVAFAGREFGLPMTTTVQEPQRVGIDRLLCCLAAFRIAEQAAIVIDAGTAITVDFVDGQGVHHGGAIAPGVAAMLAGLRDAAPALPQVSPAEALALNLPEEQPWGADTRSAMSTGVRAAAVGMVHRLVDRFALAYGGYPRVIATGGDAQALFEDDELVEHVVPDLQLAGLARAYEEAMAPDDDDDDADGHSL